MEYTAVYPFAVFFFCSSFLWYYFSSKGGNSSSAIPINWPILGMIPTIISNSHQILERATEILQQSQGTFMIKGPWFCKMELLLTADPTNVNFIMCKRHQDFHKGDNFNQIFEVLGDGIFNVDSHKWKYQRDIALSFFTSPRFRRQMDKTVQDKLDGGLTLFLDHCVNRGLVVDLQDIFMRLTADITFKLLIGEDRGELSLNPPSYSFSKVIHGGEEAVHFRHVMPMTIWKLLKWLRIGSERKLHNMIEALEGFIGETLRKKREQVMHRMKGSLPRNEGESINLVSYYIEQNYGTDSDHGFKGVDAFLRDTFFTLLLAGQDTVASALTWLFWLLPRHPKVEVKIREELIDNNAFIEGSDIYEKLRDAKSLVYLHATILEALRLYPPVPFNHRAAKQSETLPSGHRVNPWTMIILPAYSMGRMKFVWGEDYDEFKPERWITEQGEIKHVPANKFFTFNAGPRICLGKEMSLVQMKAVVCHVLRHNYRFEVVEGQRIEPASSVILMMKHGLKVKVTKDVGS